MKVNLVKGPVSCRAIIRLLLVKITDNDRNSRQIQVLLNCSTGGQEDFPTMDNLGENSIKCSVRKLENWMEAVE